MPSLLELYEKYRQGISFYGVIPNKFYSMDTIKAFVKDYHVDFEVLLDPEFKLTNYFHATTAPEVVFINNEGKILYRGKIDNAYFALGKKRSIVDEFYLRDALASYSEGKAIQVKETKPVGCLIQLP